jgi:hypothetical protein
VRRSGIVCPRPFPWSSWLAAFPKNLKTVAFIVALAFVTPVCLNAQSTETASRRVYLGGSLAMATAGINAVSSGCFSQRSEVKSELQLDVRAGVRIRGPVYAEAVLSGHTELETFDCVDALLIPVGDFFRDSIDGLTSYPYATTVARLVLDPAPANAVFRGSLFGGAGLVLGGSVPLFQAGGAVSAGGPKGRLFLEVSGTWLRDRYRTIRRQYRNESGESYDPVLLNESAQSHVTHVRMLLVNLGFQHRL